MIAIGGMTAASKSTTPCLVDAARPVPAAAPLSIVLFVIRVPCSLCVRSLLLGYFVPIFSLTNLPVTAGVHLFPRDLTAGFHQRTNR